MAVFFKVLFFNFIVKSENCPEYGQILNLFKQALSILLFLSSKNKAPSSDTYTKKISSFTIFFFFEKSHQHNLYAQGDNEV